MLIRKSGGHNAQMRQMGYVWCNFYSPYDTLSLRRDGAALSIALLRGSDRLLPNIGTPSRRWMNQFRSPAPPFSSLSMLDFSSGFNSFGPRLAFDYLSAANGIRAWR